MAHRHEYHGIHSTRRGLRFRFSERMVAQHELADKRPSRRTVIPLPDILTTVRPNIGPTHPIKASTHESVWPTRNSACGKQQN